MRIQNKSPRELHAIARGWFRILRLAGGRALSIYDEMEYLSGISPADKEGTPS